MSKNTVKSNKVGNGDGVLRVTIPKDICRELELVPGDWFCVSNEGSRVIMEKV